MTRRTLLIAAATTAFVVGIVASLLFARDPGPAEPAAAPSNSLTPTAVAPSGTGSAIPGFGDPITDVLGRKVMMPNNPSGQILDQREPAAGRGECAAAAAVSSPESVMIQRSYNLPILLSATDGPARLEGTVLAGYRHSVQGAVLAGWNWVSRTFAGGTPSYDTVSAMTVMSDADRANLETPPPVDPATTRFRNVTAAPEAFRVLSCDSGFAAIELALRVLGNPDTTSTGQTWLGLRLNLLWRNDDWRMQATDDVSGIGGGQRYNSLDQAWTRWSF